MNCPRCGKEVESGGVFCPSCGERLDLGQDANAPPADLPQGFAESSSAAGGVSEPVPSGEPPAPSPAVQQLRDIQRARADTDDDVERELWTGRFSGRAMIGTWLVCGLVSVLLLVFGIWMTVKGWVANWSVIFWIVLLVLLVGMWGYYGLLLLYRRMSIRYRLTTQRFFHEEGILRHVSNRIEVIDMDDIASVQTILQRLVNVGTIHITSSDRSHPVLHVTGIENAKQVAAMMDDLRRKERIRRGLHIEAV